MHSLEEEEEDDPESEDGFNRSSFISVCTANYETLQFQDLPEDVLISIFRCMPAEEMKKSRLVCSQWNNIICNTSELMRYRTCFFFDGHRGENGARCDEYFQTEGDSAASLWNTFRVKNASARHISWIDARRTATITRLEFHNCSFHWSVIVKTLMEFDNLWHLQDIQDMYLWDYAMFNEGISEEQSIIETNEYPQFVETGRLSLLSNLRHVKVHRSNIRDCTTYLKILELRCDNLETLEMTTDCNFPVGRATKLYTALGSLLAKNSKCLTKLRFPFKNIYTPYDLRMTEDQRPFRDFLTFVSREEWATRLDMRALVELHLSFPMVHLDQEDIEQKLRPFLNQLHALQNFKMSTVSLEGGQEDVLMSMLPEAITKEFDIYITDGRPIPELRRVIDYATSITVQTWRINATEVKSLLVLQDVTGEPLKFTHTKEFQYFSKSHTFKDFNLDNLAPSFQFITHMNLVDHNTRVEHRHPSEALATIEDEDFQSIIRYFVLLKELQIIANMAYLTDSGMTGLKPEACKRMLRLESYVRMSNDVEGVAVSDLKYLRSLVLRGLGIKITDVTLRFAFGSMDRLRKLHLFGSPQTTPAMKTLFHQQFPNTRGYDIEIR